MRERLDAGDRAWLESFESRYGVRPARFLGLLRPVEPASRFDARMSVRTKAERLGWSGEETLTPAVVGQGGRRLEDARRRGLLDIEPEAIPEIERRPGRS